MENITITCELCHQEFQIEAYGDGNCSHCGQAYEYFEGFTVALNDEQIALLTNKPPQSSQPSVS